MAALLLFAGAFSGISANGSESLTVRFRFGKAEADLSALESLVAGKDVERIEIRASSSPDGPYWVNKQLAQDRAAFVVGKLQELGVDEGRLSTTVVAEDWAGVARWLRRSGKAYKDEALKIVNESEASVREEKLQDLWAGEAWDDLMRGAFPSLRCVRVTIYYKEDAEPAPEPKVKLEVPDGGLRLLFPAGIRYVHPEFANNADVLEIVRGLVAEGKSLRIESYASPEGDPVCNATLAKNRADCVRAYLVEKFAVPESKITLESKGEDWSGLFRQVQDNYNGEKRDELLQILGEEGVSGASRKAAIRAMDGGATWRNLVKDQMPALRSVQIVAE